MKTMFTPSIDELMSNRDYFNSFVYTTVEQAVQELEWRKANSNIKEYVTNNLNIAIPYELKGEKNAVLGRQLASPNYELNRFSNEADKLTGFKKTVIVKHNDKFTPGINETKYHLGKLVFKNKNSNHQNTKSIMAVDFNQNAGKPMSEVNTTWGQSLVDFHNELLEYGIANEGIGKINQFEGSEWLLQGGKTAKEYYPKLLLLFLQNGLLFENFLMKEKAEATFTKEIFLPAFMKIFEETGVKPLIISFLPIESEENNFWNYYPDEYFEFVKNKMKVSELMQNRVAA